ncbi:MAG: YdcF family protein [Pseudomonadota bacterium]
MRFILSIIMLAAIAWSGALVWFVHSMPTRSVPASVTTDAIVVLTGGKARVEHGIAMLAEGSAPILFISGVGEHVTTAQMLSEHASAPVQQKIRERRPEIIFDYIARSTLSNADQTARFIRERGIHSIRLVTASYHMKRSVREFEVAMPGLTIIADPVFPEGFRRDEWWVHENTRRLVFSEFYKYFATLLIR